MVTKLILLLGVLAPALCFIDMVEKIVKLWPEADPTYDDVARISYSDLVNGDVDSLIKQSMQEYGIFYVVDVPNYDSHEELKYLQQFFNLPEELKAGTEIRRHNPANKNAYRGYCPGLDDVDATLQYKNLFNIGPHETRAPISEDNILTGMDKLRYDIHEPNVWPQTGDCAFDKEFKEIFQKGFEFRQTIARKFVQSISRSLDLPKLNDLFQEDEFSAMGLRRYPKRDRINTNMYSDFDGTLLRELEHIDSTVTVLTTFDNGGLQGLYKNQYRNMPATGANSFVVMIGKLVDDLVDNQLFSVKHRVIETPFDRHSITYFLGPQFDADISRSVTEERRLTEAGRKYTIFGEWIKDYLGAIELFYY